MEKLLVLSLLLSTPAVADPRCAVVYDGVCFKTQAQYDEYMGWGAQQQQLETEANK
jgi:hypothetical protein